MLVDSTELLAWVRVQVIEERSIADHLPAGPWVLIPQKPSGYPQDIENPAQRGMVIATTYAEPGEPPIVGDHILRHQPDDATADLDAKLRILDYIERIFADSDSEVIPTWQETRHEVAQTMLRILGYGYRHRPGYRADEWGLHASIDEDLHLRPGVSP